MNSHFVKYYEDYLHKAQNNNIFNKNFYLRKADLNN